MSGDPDVQAVVIADGASDTGSIRDAGGAFVEGRSLCSVRVPALTAGSAFLLLQTSESGPDVLDAAAVWDNLYDEDGVQIGKLPVSTAAARRVCIQLGRFERLGRCRFVAVQADGTTVQAQTGAKTLHPRFREVR
ncbi:MAG TPA: hypothetical protein PK435_14240 [Thermoanaerobaculaceae bacterium]|nr:hypothetical protein [Thermoanaerobaculaceae bacterium]